MVWVDPVADFKTPANRDCRRHLRCLEEWCRLRDAKSRQRQCEGGKIAFVMIRCLVAANPAGSLQKPCALTSASFATLRLRTSQAVVRAIYPLSRDAERGTGLPGLSKSKPFEQCDGALVARIYIGNERLYRSGFKNVLDRSRRGFKAEATAPVVRMQNEAEIRKWKSADLANNAPFKYYEEVGSDLCARVDVGLKPFACVFNILVRRSRPKAHGVRVRHERIHFAKVALRWLSKSQTVSFEFHS